MLKRLAPALACLLCLTLVAQNKKQKSWTEWSKDEAEKMLNDSAWAQTQTYTDTTEMTYSPTTAGRSSSRDTEGAKNQATNIKYRIRFFSARPIREALVRSMLLDMKNSPDAQTVERMKSFAELRANESIIITVSYEASDGRMAGAAMQTFNSATTGVLKQATYLERKDGKRLYLTEYVPPGKDGFGARFIFPRMSGESPFLTEDAGEVRFYSQLNKATELNMRFKLARMIYNDALEY
ncbi:MAG: hypothetical protein QOE33_563 [Acidobacteriota bacterium]|nr:hypothetical protein [Acidobacteriota bacterium]